MENINLDTNNLTTSDFSISIKKLSNEINFDK